MKSPLLLLVATATFSFAQHNGTNTVPPPVYSTSLYEFGNASLTATSTQYVTLPVGAISFPAGSNFTIEFWVNSTAAACAGGSGYPVVIGAADGSWFIAQVSTSNTINVAFPNISSGANIVGTVSICDSTWHHVAIVFSGGGTTLGIWVDGNNANSGGVPQTGLGTVGAIGGTTTLGYFSRMTVHYWTGSIDELSIWNYAKWTSMFTRPTGPYTGSEAGLVSLYHLDGNPGDSYSTATSIQTVPVSATAPASGQALVDQSGSYVPMTLTTLATSGLGTTTTGSTSAQVNVSMSWRCVGPATACTNKTTSDTLSNSDCGGLVTYNNTTATTVSVPQAGLSGFAAGCPITLTNYGSAAVNFSVSPGSTFASGVTGHTIHTIAQATISSGDNGATSVFHSCLLISDGTNWQVGACN